VEAAELGQDDVVIEVGPGLGVLTEQLAATAGRVVAVELDAKLAGRLRERFGTSNAHPAPSNKESAAGFELQASSAGQRVEDSSRAVSVVEGDVLAITPVELLERAGVDVETAYVVVANLPYNIGAAVLRHFLESEWPPRRMVVMLQREVAASIAAQPGQLGLLGVSVQIYARAKRLFNVAPRAFYPPPKVMSSVILLDVREEPLVDPNEREGFFAVVRAGFSAPRKQLRNSLANGLRLPAEEASAAIEAAGLDATRRPQELAIEDWLRLSRIVGSTGLKPEAG
jgi:16S rRNA (adenine1518-N6/adenine1519-N6)-dimethyltransferase